MLALVMTAAAVQGASPTYVAIEGPTLLSTGETQAYQVTALGGPAEGGGTYSFVVTVVSGDATVSPGNGESEDGSFEFNLTANAAGRILLTVEATSTMGAEFDSDTNEYSVAAVDPVVISATVSNSGNATVTGVPVSYLVDGEEVYNTTIDLGAGEQTLLRYNWTEADLDDGEHTATVVIDPEGDFIMLANGGTTYSTTFYVGERDYGTTNTIFIVLILLLGVLAVILYRRKPVKKKRKGRKRK